MNPAMDARLRRLDRWNNQLLEAMESLAAVIENPELGSHEPQRVALLEALTWLEIEATCGDCISGRCHWGGNRSLESIAAADTGGKYTDPVFGRCGCSRHEISVQTRQRRARREAIDPPPTLHPTNRDLDQMEGP